MGPTPPSVAKRCTFSFSDDCHLAVEFDLDNRLLDNFVAAKQPADLSPEIRRHRPSITGAVVVEMGGPSSAYPLARDHNAMQQRAQAFDPSDKPCAVVDEGLAFAAEPFGVFFVDGRNANVSCYRTVTAQPGSQDACHFFRVQPDRSISHRTYARPNPLIGLAVRRGADFLQTV